MATVILSRLIELDYCRPPCPPAKNMNLSRIVERRKGMGRARNLHAKTNDLAGKLTTNVTSLKDSEG